MVEVHLIKENITIIFTVYVLAQIEYKIVNHDKF